MDNGKKGVCFYFHNKSQLSMYKVKYLLFLLLPLCVILCFIFVFRNSYKQDEVNVLFIGNSLTYTEAMPDIFSKIAKSKNKDIYVDYSLCKGGYTLKQFWDEGNALKMLKSKKWDYVILQEHGATPIADKNEFHTYVRLFSEEVRSAKAETVLYITSRSGLNGTAMAERQDPLTKAYTEIADELRCKIIPVGPTWVELNKYNPNLKFYGSDDLHPSKLGAYVAACVFYSVIFEESPEGAAFDDISEFLNADEAINTQKKIWTIVSKYRKGYSYQILFISIGVILILGTLFFIMRKRVVSRSC